MKEFTMSMFASKEDMYKAKAEYYEGKYCAVKEFAEELIQMYDSERHSAIAECSMRPDRAHAEQDKETAELMARLND